MIVGAILTSIFCTCFVLLGLYLRCNTKLKLKRAYKRNCIANAELVQSSYDELNRLHTCVYEYQYRGETYSYRKMHFSEDPLPQIRLFWEEGHADKPIEVSEMHSDYSSLLKYGVATAIASLLGAFILPQLTLIFVGILVLCICARESMAGKIGIAVMVLPILASTILWMDANIDPMAYEYVSYDVNTLHPEIRAQLSIIDTLDEVQLCELYEDVMYANMDINEGTEGRKFPIFGQFVNKHWQTMETFEWPAGYEKYVSWEYRSEVFEDHYDW